MTPVRPLSAQTDPTLDVVLCWHMHQPDYRLGGQWQRPWTWLHAIKDYTDMAAHLERVVGARAVVNFSPVLILQLGALADRLGAAVSDGAAVGEPLLDALAGQPIADEHALQRALLRAHQQNMAERFPRYRRLAERASAALSSGNVLAPGPRNDLLCGYVLCWLGESVRADARAQRLEQLETFAAADRRSLLELVATEIARLVSRYQALADAGTVELSVTPYSHPILPLLLDFGVAAEALPGVVLPQIDYPGGGERCDWQLAEAIAVFRSAFGRSPLGCWPSEGGLSAAVLEAIGRHGFRWTASGAAVLRNSLDGPDAHAHLRAWRLDARRTPACFFRDDALSDRIGFQYASWPAAAAVADFVQHLEAAQAALPTGSRGVLSIIMDGENAWEYYPENGWAFLEGLYQALVDHPRLRLATFSDVLEDCVVGRLPRLTAGSWVHGTFSTWIGNQARNRAWDLLVEAKRVVDAAFDQRAQADPAWRRQIEQQLAVSEASDWFWWLDENNPHPDVAEFDALYRAQLAWLYRLLGQLPPDRLRSPVRASVAHREAGPLRLDESTMRRSAEDA